MDEEELMPGIDGRIIEIRLGEEHRVQDEVIPEPRRTVTVEDYIQQLQVHIDATREQALGIMGVRDDRQEELRPAVNNEVAVLNQMQNHLQNEVNARMNDNNNYIPVENQPLAQLPVEGHVIVQGENGEFTYDNPIRRRTYNDLVEELETQRGDGLEARVNTERTLEILREVARDTGLMAINTERPPVENIQEINLGARITTRRAGATQGRPLDDGFFTEAAAIPTRAQRGDTWGEITWKDHNEERVRKVENLKKELIEFIGTLEESDSIKRIQDYIDRY